MERKGKERKGKRACPRRVPRRPDLRFLQGTAAGAHDAEFFPRMAIGRPSNNGVTGELGAQSGSIRYQSYSLTSIWRVLSSVQRAPVVHLVNFISRT